jgi:hypothetical protein
MIAFSCMSYLEAVGIDKEQNRIIDQILSTSDLHPACSQDRIDAAIDHVMQPVTLYSSNLAQTQGV